MNRLIRVTNVLVAEVMPDGTIRWWELDPVPGENTWQGVKGCRAARDNGEGLRLKQDSRTQAKQPAHSLEDLIRMAEEC